MTSRLLYVVILALGSMLLSCNKVNYYPGVATNFAGTKVLGHRGYGAFNPDFQENTFLAANEGMRLLDGVEVDIQISKDGSIWLAHNAELPDCRDIKLKCFSESTDDQIVALDSCLGPEFVFSQLEPIFELLATKYPEDYISLDVKAWAPCGVGSSDILGMMNLVGETVITLARKYGIENRVMVESETATFLQFVQKRSDDIGVYLVSFGDFERAMQLSLESGFTGIAFQYKEKEEISHKEIKLLRRKGLKIQLWTVNDTNQIIEALSIEPDFIQTDKVSYFK